jgi:hypothetical protein
VSAQARRALTTSLHNADVHAYNGWSGLSDAVDGYSSAAGIATRTSRRHVWAAACSRGYLYVGRCVRIDQRQQCGSARGGSRRQHHAREPARSRGTRRCCPRSCAPGRGRGSRTAGPRARGRRRVGQAPSATAGGLPSHPAAAGDSIPCATPTCAVRAQSSTAREYWLRSRVGRLRALGILWHLSDERCRAAGVELSPFPFWPRRAPISCPAADARTGDLSPGLGRRSTSPRIVDHTTAAKDSAPSQVCLSPRTPCRCIDAAQLLCGSGAARRRHPGTCA